MSHTLFAKGGTKFTYNGGFDGEVEIDQYPVLADLKPGVVTVDMGDLVEFVAEYVRQKRIERLEEMQYPDEILGVQKR